MKLLINTSTVSRGGAKQVALSFLSECKAIDKNKYGVIIGPGLKSEVDESSFPDNFSFFYIIKRPAQNIIKSLKGDIFDNIEKEFKPDCVFTPTGPSYWKSKAPQLIGYNLPHYIYPESPYFNIISRSKRLKWWIKGQLIRQFYRRDATAIVCQAEDVRLRASKFLGIKMSFTVSNTCGEHYFNFIDNSMRPYPKSRSMNVLIFSVFYEHKNIEVLNGVCEEIDRDPDSQIRFLTTLPEPDFNRIFTLKAQKYIKNIGPVLNKDGPEVYKSADIMFLPSLLECFSANYPEAMSMGIPIITSNLSFAKSICGSAALYINPMDPKDIFEALKSMNNSIKESLVLEGYERLNSFPRPRERALQYLEICENIIS